MWHLPSFVRSSLSVLISTLVVVINRLHIIIHTTHHGRVITVTAASFRPLSAKYWDLMSRPSRGISICSFAASAPSIDGNSFFTTSSQPVLIGRWMLKARHFRLSLPLPQILRPSIRLIFLPPSPNYYSQSMACLSFSMLHSCRKHENPFWDPFPELSDIRRGPCITRGLLLVRLFPSLPFPSVRPSLHPSNPPQQTQKMRVPIFHSNLILSSRLSFTSSSHLIQPLQAT